ncbi:helix-hairpin-helix domain-containing protein [Streptomyces sp. NPDC047725]|uniref:helix-hairpin-helix domain-containing protein n=1 Tax=Streptomyces sp. NPDC047725 TaxID=3365487 RepID=UPI003721EB7C
MALRSHPRTAAASSGPGRGPASDGRVRRPRRRPGTHGRHRHASAAEVRRRADALFGERTDALSGERADVLSRERAGAWGEPGAQAPPGGGGAGDPGDGPGVGRSPVGVRSGGADDDVGLLAPTRRERAGAALRERMPLWLQNRCGMERRSVAALTVLLVVAAVLAAQHFWAGRTETVAAPEVVRQAPAGEARGEDGTAAEEGTAPGAPGAAATASAGAEIVVDVGGRVREPGVHRLPAGSRVEDALRAAGGVRPGTKTEGLNRARFLVDGEQIVVGAPGTVPGGTAAGGPGAPAGTVAGAGPAAPVSLSTATVEQLDTLPGVGPVLAQHIVDYRTRHGGFRSVDELREVNGIGERRFADLRDLVRP